MSQDLEKRVAELEKRVADLEKLIASGAQPQDREYIEGYKRTDYYNQGTKFYFKTSKDRVLESRRFISYNFDTNYPSMFKSILISIGKEDLLKGESKQDYKECAMSLFAKYGKNGYALFDNGMILDSSVDIYETTPSSKKIKF